MIVYALITRTKDGLPLSASTDFSHEDNRNIKENKRYVKLVANKAASLPERCELHLKDFTIYMHTCRDVSYLVMTEFHYPPTLAFCFLVELIKEFLQKYDDAKIFSARRPYHFIEYDSFIHKTRQAYNRPVNMSTRLNIADVNTELDLRPPYKLAVTDIEPTINGFRHADVPQMGVGPPPKLSPLNWFGFLGIFFSGSLIALDCLRGFTALHNSSIEVYKGPSPAHGLTYILEASIMAYQIYLLLYNRKHRKLQSWLSLVLLFGCIYFLWDLRDPEQHGVFVLSGFFTHLCTVTRNLESKLPDYHV